MRPAFWGLFLRSCLPSGRRALIVKRTYFPRRFWVWFYAPKSGHDRVAACVGSPKASSQLLRAHVETVALTPLLTARLLWLISRFFSSVRLQPHGASAAQSAFSGMQEPLAKPLAA